MTLEIDSVFIAIFSMVNAFPVDSRFSIIVSYSASKSRGYDTLTNLSPVFDFLIKGSAKR